MVLKDMGKAGTAVLIFGLAACSSEPTSNATPTDDPDATTTTDPGAAPTSTAAVSASTTPTVGQPSTNWARVNLGVSAYVVYRGGEAAVVDTGNPGSGEAINAALGTLGLDWNAVGHIVITHRHPDHQGSLDSVISATGAPWYAGAGDLSAINAQSDGNAVGDGDTVFDLQIIETPGHTEGHISVLDPAGGFMISGDALNGANGGVTGPNPQFTPDMETANASVKKLAMFDFEAALFGHGEPVLSGADVAVAALAETL